MPESGIAQKPTRMARALLSRPPARQESLGALFAAAGLFAAAALALATTVVMLPTPWPR